MSTALAKTRDLLERAQPQIAAVLPRHMSAERVVRMASFACGQNNKLLECSPTKLLTEVMRAAALGLDVGGVSGTAYIVPYKGVPKLVVGYKGYIELAMRSGKVRKVVARLVYDGDHFDYDLGINERLEHKPKHRASGWDNVTHAYAFAKLTGGDSVFEVLTREQIEQRRGRSATSNSDRSPWTTDPEAMARKTAIRALVPLLPQSPEIAAALELDHRADLGHATGHSEILDALPVVEVEHQRSNLSDLTAKLSKAPATPHVIASVAGDGVMDLVPVSPDEAAEIAAAEREPGSDDA